MPMGRKIISARRVGHFGPMLCVSGNFGLYKEYGLNSTHDVETVLLITPWFTLLCKQKRSAWAQCQTWRVYQIPGDTVIVCVKICNSVSVWIMHSTVFCDANLLPVILQSPQSLMPVCCQSSYRVHNLWCQLVACHPTESTIFDRSLLQVSIHSTNCCQSSHSVHDLWCQLVASHGTESTVCLLYCSLNFMYYYFTIPPLLPKHCPLWDE